MNDQKPKTVFDERAELFRQRDGLVAQNAQLHAQISVIKEALRQVQLESAELREETSQWKAQATNRGVSYVELFAEKQHVQKQLNEALNENARLKDENAALKVGEAGELLAKAQKEASKWMDFYKWCSDSFDKYRLDVESGELYKSQKKVMYALIDERNELVSELEAQKDSFRELSKIWADTACRRYVAEKVADAAVAVEIAKGALGRASKVEGFLTRPIMLLIGARDSAQFELQEAVREYRAHIKEAA